MSAISPSAGKYLWRVKYANSISTFTAWILTDVRSIKVVAAKPQALARRRTGSNQFYGLKVRSIEFKGTIDG